LPKDVVDFQFDPSGLGNVKADLSRGVEGIGIILVENIGRRHRAWSDYDIKLIKVESTNISYGCVWIQRQVWIPRINAGRICLEMKVVTGQELWIKEDIVVGIAGIAIGVDGVRSADLRWALGRVAIEESEVPARITEKVAVDDLASSAVLKVDCFPSRKGDNRAVESGPGIAAVNSPIFAGPIAYKSAVGEVR
jgi:hypothetical protein